MVMGMAKHPALNAFIWRVSFSFAFDLCPRLKNQLGNHFSLVLCGALSVKKKYDGYKSTFFKIFDLFLNFFRFWTILRCGGLMRRNEAELGDMWRRL